MKIGLIEKLDIFWVQIKGIYLLIGAEIKIWRYEWRLKPLVKRQIENQELIEDGWQTWERAKSKAKKERLRRQLQHIEIETTHIEQELGEMTDKLENLKNLVRFFWRKLFE